MPTGNLKYEAAANEALCNMLGAAGATAASALVYSWLGGPPVGGTAAVIAGLSGLAYAYACPWDTTGIEQGGDISGCQDGGPSCEMRVLFENAAAPGSGLTSSTPFFRGPLTVTRTEAPSAGAPDKFILTVSDQYGVSYPFEQVPANTTPITEFKAGSPCDCVTPFPDGPTAPPFTPPAPYTYTDPDDGCQISVTFEAFAQDQAGRLMPVWKMNPILPPSARAGGEIIGGCNFAPTVYVQPTGPGGPPDKPPTIIEPIPVPEGPDGKPWWWPFLEGAMRWTAEQALEALFADLLEPKYPATNYTLNAACEYKADGTPETFTQNFPEQSALARLLSWQSAQLGFIQQHLLWKTPTCSGGGQSVTGDAVSINWVSDEYSPNGNNRIRKLLTYFDQVGSTLEQTVAHWRDFTWNAGPVIVSCVGTPLGRPQVWADSIDEAKRVIQHAATIAGVDLTKAEWQVAPPKSSRYGMAGLMRVHRSENGTLGITKRDGPSGLPMGLT